MLTQSTTGEPSYRLRLWRVLRADENVCDVWSSGEQSSVRFAALFPSPRVERVSPGHLVAVATSPNGDQAIVWRWYDAVVLGVEDDGSVRLWEPAHGEVTARQRESFLHPNPAERAYASAGLPGADWWVAGSAVGAPVTAAVDVAEVAALYADNNLWPRVFPQ